MCRAAPTEGLLKKVAGEGLRIVSSWRFGLVARLRPRRKRSRAAICIHARKVYSSGAPDGDVMNTSAVYDDPQAGSLVVHFPAAGSGTLGC